MKKLLFLIILLCLPFLLLGQITMTSSGGSAAVTETATTYTITKTNIVLAGAVTVSSISFTTVVATTSITVGSDALNKDGAVIWIDAGGGTGNATIASDALAFSGFSGGVDVDGAFTAATIVSDGNVGGTTITASTGFILGDGDYIGISASDEKITFNTAGSINVTGATFDVDGAFTASTVTSDAGIFGAKYIGLGTADIEAWDAGYSSVLQFVNGAIHAGESGAFGLGFTDNGYFDGFWKARSTDPSMSFLAANGTMLFRVSNGSDNADATIAWTSALLISNSADMAFNEDGIDADFRIETAGEDSALVVDGADGDVYMEGLGTGTGTALSRVANTDEIVEESSSRRFKDNIEDWIINTSTIMKLQPRQFDWNEKSAVNGLHDYGMVAEEVKEVLPEAIHYKDGQVQAWSQTKVITLLVAIIQEHQREIDMLKLNSK